MLKQAILQDMHHLHSFRQCLLLICLGLACTSHSAQAQTIITIAGNGIAGYAGDGAQCLNAALYYPNAVATNGFGTIYISDFNNYRIRKITPSGIISTIAGNGIQGFTGDGGKADTTELGYISGIALDRQGNVYISDNNHNRIRKIDTLGIITTIAGTGTAGFTGDGAPAVHADILSPTGIAIDAYSHIYFADAGNHRIREIDSYGIIHTVAGDGTSGNSGDGGPAILAQLNYVTGIAVDPAGNLFIADNFENRIRKVDTSGTITAFAGTGTQGYTGDWYAAILAELSAPQDIVTDRKGNVFISDLNNDVIRKVGPGGIITTIAGCGLFGFSGDGGPATSAQLDIPKGMACDAGGNLLFADNSNNRIRLIYAPTGIQEQETLPPVLLYPVPVQQTTTLRLPGSGYISLHLIDEQGRVCYTQQLDSNHADQNLILDCQALAPGIYSLQVQTKHGIQHLFVPIL